MYRYKTIFEDKLDTPSSFFFFNPSNLDEIL